MKMHLENLGYQRLQDTYKNLSSIVFARAMAVDPYFRKGGIG
jgi:hypothetical protein